MTGELIDSIFAHTAIFARHFNAVINIRFTTVPFEASVCAVTTKVVHEIDTAAMFTGLIRALVNVSLAVLTCVTRNA